MMFETRVETVTTADGWRLPLRRFTPSLRSDPTPVLCVHGHATNGWSWWGGPERGVVGGLLADGREVWTVDLRGAATTEGPRRRAPVRIADKLLEDLPAAVRHVLDRQPASAGGALDVVGHSLGGVMIYLLGLAGDPVAAHIRRAVTIGSPLRVPESSIPAPLLGRGMSSVVKRLHRLPVCGLAATLGRHTPIAAMSTHFAPGEVGKQTLAGFMRHGVTDVFGPELTELAAWVREGDARVLHPGLTTRDAPGRLPFPTRFIVGAQDGLTTAHSVTETHALIGGDDLSAGVESDLHVLPGFRHADVLIGRRAPTEVAPRVAAWLASASAPRAERDAIDVGYAPVRRQQSVARARA